MLKMTDNTNLETLLKTLKVEFNKKNIGKILHQLLSSKLILVKDTNSSNLKFQTIKDNYNEYFYLVFTSYDNLVKWSNNDFEEIQVVELEDILNLLYTTKTNICNGFIINPNNEQVFFDQDLIRYCLNKIDYQPNKFINNLIKVYTNLKIYDFSEFPDDFAWELKRVLWKHPKVQAAYLQIVKNKNDQKYGFVFKSKKDCLDLHSEIKHLAKETLEIYNLEFFSSESELGKEIMKSEPIYSRQFIIF